MAGFSLQSALAADNVSEEDFFFAELPVVLSASRLSQPQNEAPNAMTVISRDMIEASGFRQIADLLRLVPGMYVGYENGFEPIVAYHGAFDNYSRYMQVLVDGRSVYLPPGSNVSWEDIPLHLDDIERIEVVRGPAAASHGANSLHGVINIITREASGVNGTVVTAAKGDGGVSDMALHLGRSSGKLDYRATLAYRADDGFSTGLLNDSHATRLANLRAAYQHSMQDSIELQLGYSEGSLAQGTEGRDTDLFRNARSVSSFQQLTWLRVLPQQDELKLNYYHIYRDYLDDQPADILGNPNPESHVVNRQELELQHTAQLSTGNRLVWGGGLRTDEAENPLRLQSPQRLNQSRLFAHDEWRMSDKALLNLGAMYEDDGMGHRNTSPRIALNYHAAPGHTLRASGSVAYRSPAMLEEKGVQTGYFYALGGVRPERIDSRELGYLGTFGESGASLDARVYYDRMEDMIYFDPTPIPPSTNGTPYSFSNLMSATYKGFESTLRHRMENSELVLNYSRQWKECAVTGSLREPLFLPVLQDHASSCSRSVPLDTASLLLSRQLPGSLQISAGYYYRSAFSFVATTVPLTAMRRLDLRAAKGFDGKGEIALVVQNALRDGYTEYDGGVSQTVGRLHQDRRIYLSAALRF